MDVLILALRVSGGFNRRVGLNGRVGGEGGGEGGKERKGKEIGRCGGLDMLKEEKRKEKKEKKEGRFEVFFQRCFLRKGGMSGIYKMVSYRFFRFFSFLFIS